MDSERDCLRAIVKKGQDWRERDRAETILLLAAGHSVQAVAEHQGLCREAVRIRRRKWLKSGLASLPDQPRSGAPSKLTDKQRQELGKWVEGEALVLPGVADAARTRIPGCHGSNDIAHGTEATGLCVETHPLQLEKKRDPEQFEQARVEIDELIKQAQAGEIELAYVDEAGFAPQPPNRSAWSKVGETHAVVSKRSQRLNVISALLSSGRLIMPSGGKA